MKDKDNLDKSQIYSILGFATVMIVVGTPTWWMTTSVYRVDLPYDKMTDHPSNLTLDVRITLIDSTDQHLVGPQIQELLNVIQGDAVYNFKFSARKPSPSEQQLLESERDFSLLDESLWSLQDGIKRGTILLYELPYNTDVIVIGNHRSVFFGRSADIGIVTDVVRESICGENVIRKLRSSIDDDTRRSHDRLSLRRVAASGRGYDVLFTLLVPEPEVVDISWDIRAAVEAFVLPFTDSLRNFSSFQIKSQVLYLTKLNLNPKSSIDGTYLVTPKDLGIAINSVESQLTSHVSSNPSLNFLTYIPPRSQTPLVISTNENDNDQRLRHAFMIPKWGGAFIYNIDKTSTSHSIDMNKIMSVYITQMRLLLGIQQEVELKNVQFLKHSGLRTWEAEFLLKLRGLENLIESRHTLQSLAHLLSQISNIVITDEIGAEVEKSVKCFEEGVELLTSGMLEEGFAKSKCAYIASEIAFFDPSLLALLYFPEDQKYAIYIPLFLPVGIPVVMSLVSVYKFWKNKKIS